MEYPIMNEYQTEITEELLKGLPKEVGDDLLEIINSVPYVKNLISPSRQRAKDRPRDEKGRIIVDLINPHILEDMDYFRPSALYYKKYGVYNKARPNANPNSEYGKWLRLERDRCWNGYVRESDGEWVTGLLYFYMNYCPIIQSKIRKGTKQADRVVDFPETWEGIYLRFHYIHQARNGGVYNNLEGGNHGAELASRGKAFAYSLNIETPDGRKKWRDINVGDILFAPDGTTTTVIDIPFDLLHDVYRMTLTDGREIFTTLEHLWKINKNGENWSKLYTTEEIMKSRQINRFAIEVSSGVEYPYQNVPITPYLLGLMLGDGSFTISKYNQAQFCSRQEDVLIYQKVLDFDFQLVNSKTKDTSWLIPYENFGGKAKSLGLNKVVSDTKFIPDVYKYNSKEVRLNVLKGLLDTDGSVHDNGKPEFYTTSKLLAHDVLWIVRSLGYNASYWIKKPKYKHNGVIKKGKDCYIVYIHTNDILFNLPRKIKLQNSGGFKNQSRVLKTSIKSIEYSHKEMCKCVTVDREDGLFLIGDFLTTHNSKSYSMASILSHNFILGETQEAWKETRSIVTAYLKEYLIKDGVLNKFTSMADFIAQHTQFPRKRLKAALQDMTWVMGYKDSETGVEKGTLNQVLGVSSRDDESKLRGKRAVFIGIEEFGTFSRLIDLYNILKPSVQEGDIVFGMMYLQGCVCAGTKVWNQYGEMKNIEDVVLQDKLLSYNSIENISWLQPNTKKECVRITTEGGKYIECSIDHPLIALNTDNYNHSKGTCSFYKANELKVGDKLISPKTIGSFGNINEPDAFLLGSLFGDGSYGDNSCVTLSISTEEEYEFYNSKYDINISKLSKGKNTYAQIYFRKLHPLLKKYGMDKLVKDNKKLPNNIFQWDKESICNFLGGYFNADGNVQIVKNKHRSIKLTCKYEETLILIQSLLFKIGISSHIYSENKKENILKSNVNLKSYIIKDRTCYVLYINRSEDIITFRNNIKLLQKSKQDRLNSYIKLNSKGYYKTLDFKLRDNHKGEYFVGKTIDNVIGLSIKKIEPIGYQTIYNMTADTTHTYISNGFISANTAGDNESDFAGALEIMYNPKGYNMYALPNVYDKVNQGKQDFVYFFPGYLNRKGYYNEDGVSDVIGALISILLDRYKVKYNSTDPNTIVKTVAEVPITPAEAIVKTGVNLFPIVDLTERLNQLDNNPKEYDDVYVGNLIIAKNGEIKYEMSSKTPIRTFKRLDNKMEGAIEMFQLPEKDKDGKVFSNRYILSCDPYDNDQAESLSLGSIFVLDLWTDRIVAEYTGRPLFADDFYEIARRMCLFYNGRMNYENNKKGLFAYFQRMNSLYLLTDTLDFLKDKDMVKIKPFGNTTKGTTATLSINAYATTLCRNWLLQPITMTKTYQDKEEEITVPRLFTLRNRALIEELIGYNDMGNFDRVSSLKMLMLLREDKMIMYNGNLLNSKETEKDKNYLGNDPFFSKY